MKMHRRDAEVSNMQNGLTPGLTPVDACEGGFLGATGVMENAKTPGNPGYSRFCLLYEDPALTTELRRQVVASTSLTSFPIFLVLLLDARSDACYHPMKWPERRYRPGRGHSDTRF